MVNDVRFQNEMIIHQKEVKKDLEIILNMKEKKYKEKIFLEDDDHSSKLDF